MNFDELRAISTISPVGKNGMKFIRVHFVNADGVNCGYCQVESQTCFVRLVDSSKCKSVKSAELEWRTVPSVLDYRA